MSNLPEKVFLQLMDQAVHDTWRINPISYELKKASHRKGGAQHDKVLYTAFNGMHKLLSRFGELYEEAIKKAQEAGDGNEVLSGTDSADNGSATE